jgi:hypothetical protein
MKYKIQTTTETEVDVPQFWTSDAQVYFHKLLPNGQVLEVSVADFSHIKLTTIESGVYCGVNQIGEEIFNRALELAMINLNLGVNTITQI